MNTLSYLYYICTYCMYSLNIQSHLKTYNISNNTNVFLTYNIQFCVKAHSVLPASLFLSWSLVRGMWLTFSYLLPRRPQTCLCLLKCARSKDETEKERRVKERRKMKKIWSRASSWWTPPVLLLLHLPAYTHPYYYFCLKSSPRFLITHWIIISMYKEGYGVVKKAAQKIQT